MPRLFLVRHGKPVGYEDPDPGLDEEGHAQARAIAEKLGRDLEPMGLVTSFKRRARETAAPLAKLWGVEPLVESGVSEIRSPSDEPRERIPWVKNLMAGNWSEQEADIHAWRANVIRTLTDMPSDAVIFTHFVPINAAVSSILGDDRVTCFHPGYCSVTVLETVMDELRLVEKGAEGETIVF